MPPRRRNRPLPPGGRLIRRTEDDIEIYVKPGTKTPREQFPYDFQVLYRLPHTGSRPRSPKHVHIVVDLYRKREVEPELTDAFVDHILNDIIEPVVPFEGFPPELQVFDVEHVQQFEGLNGISEYSVEFLLVAIEMIMIQERTNFPDPERYNLNQRLFRQFRNREDIFTVIGTATYRGRR